MVVRIPFIPEAFANETFLNLPYIPEDFVHKLPGNLSTIQPCAKFLCASFPRFSNCRRTYLKPFLSDDEKFVNDNYFFNDNHVSFNSHELLPWEVSDRGNSLDAQTPRH